jgi:hypothetical protein
MVLDIMRMSPALLQKTKNYIIASGAALILVVGVAVIIYSGVVDLQKQQIAARCTGYDPQWEGLFDCYGLISIFGSDQNTYQVQDNKEPGAIVAEIDNPNDFIIEGYNMYLRDIEPKVTCNNLVPGKYCGVFQVNGKKVEYDYDTADQVPTYIIINTITGDERFYVHPQEASSSVQAIFEGLQKQH